MKKNNQNDHIPPPSPDDIPIDAGVDESCGETPWETPFPGVQTAENGELEKLRAENAGLKDKYIRQMAEFDNYKKRQQKLFNDMAHSMRDDILVRLIEVLDNLDRALGTCPTAEEGNNWVDGFRLIARQIEDFLLAENIEVIDNPDEPFDPSRHEAVHVAKGTDRNPGGIVEICQKGYCRSGKLIRPAKVIVASKD